MAEQKEDTDIKRLEDMLKAVKFGDMFRPSQFESAEAASEFIAAFQKKLPITDDKELQQMEENISSVQTVLDETKRKENDAGCKWGGLHPVADAFNFTIPWQVSLCGDSKGQSLYPEFEDAHRRRVDERNQDRTAPLDTPMSKELQDICYPFMKEWREATMKGASHDEIQAIKTPYEKVPLKERVQFRIKKALKLKVDPEIDKLWQVNWVLKNDRESTDRGVWNDYMARSNEASSKYLNELLAKPYPEMIEQMNKDLPVLWEEYGRLSGDVKAVGLDLKGLQAERDKALKMNGLCDEIVEAMEGKSAHFFKVREHAHDARIQLAQKGMMSNEDVKEPTVSGVVANERVTEAKEKGQSVDWADAKKRQR